MKKERKINAPEGCEIEKVELIDGVAVVTFKEKELELPKSWEEFCGICNIKEGECYINSVSEITEYMRIAERRETEDRNVFPDFATAEAVLALCQLIQLRNCYNQGFVPDWDNLAEMKYCIMFLEDNEPCTVKTSFYERRLLYFKTKELCEEFLRDFRPLIEKLKPLYGIKEGGEE